MVILVHSSVHFYSDIAPRFRTLKQHRHRSILRRPSFHPAPLHRYCYSQLEHRIYINKVFKCGQQRETYKILDLCNYATVSYFVQFMFMQLQLSQLTLKSTLNWSHVKLIISDQALITLKSLFAYKCAI